METKKCNKCGRELPIEDFVKNSRIKSGYSSHCKKCHGDYAKKSKDRSMVKDAPKVEESVLKEIHECRLEDIPARLLIHELRRRGYRGKLELVTIQEVVI